MLLVGLGVSVVVVLLKFPMLWPYVITIFRTIASELLSGLLSVGV